MSEITKTQSGFTLIELVIVVAILAATAALAIPSAQFVKSFRVQSAASELMSNLQNLRSKSITSRSETTSRGFGVRFTGSGSSYTLFEFNDVDSDFSYDGSSEEKDAEVFDLPSSIEVKKKDAAMPDGTTLFFGSKGMARTSSWSAVGNMTITLNHADSDVTARCIAVDAVRLRKGIWNAGTCD